MFCVGSRVRHETPAEGWRTYRPKRGEYDNEDWNIVRLFLVIKIINTWNSVTVCKQMINVK